MAKHSLWSRKDDDEGEDKHEDEDEVEKDAVVVGDDATNIRSSVDNNRPASVIVFPARPGKEAFSLSRLVSFAPSASPDMESRASLEHTDL